MAATQGSNATVWILAREKLFPEDSPLCSIRRHGLRCSVITTWQTLAVLLDTCLGLVRGDVGGLAHPDGASSRQVPVAGCGLCAQRAR